LDSWILVIPGENKPQRGVPRVSISLERAHRARISQDSQPPAAAGPPHTPNAAMRSWAAKLALGLGCASLASGQNITKSTKVAASSLFIADINATISINLPPDSDDVNFLISAPTWMSWFGVGFGSTMAKSLMLVVYASGDRKRELLACRFAAPRKLTFWRRCNCQSETGNVSGALVRTGES